MKGNSLSNTGNRYAQIKVNNAHWLFTAAAAFCLLACAPPKPPGPIERAWTEDVLLDDGSTIVVKRTVSFKESNSWSGDAYNAVEVDATLSFTGELGRLPVWRAPLMALLLYRDATDEWVLVATTTSCDVWNDRGAPRLMYLPDKPQTIYWEYRLRATGWQEVPLSRTSVGKGVNLLHRYQDDLGTTYVSVAFRKQREPDSGPVKDFVAIQASPYVVCDPNMDTRQKWDAEIQSEKQQSSQEH
jgi:hypothetical protein